MRAMAAESIPCDAGYIPLDQNRAVSPYLDARSERPCPVAAEAARATVWLRQQVLMGEPDDLDDVLEAARRVQRAVS